MLELKTLLPGNSQLQVQVWDYDPIVTDDLIGETIIDLVLIKRNKIKLKI